MRPDVRHYFDEAPFFVSGGSGGTNDWQYPGVSNSVSPHFIGRLSGSLRRAARSAVAYDLRGRAHYAGRQMAMLPAMRPAAGRLTGDSPSLA